MCTTRISSSFLSSRWFLSICVWNYDLSSWMQIGHPVSGWMMCECDCVCVFVCRGMIWLGARTLAPSVRKSQERGRAPTEEPVRGEIEAVCLRCGSDHHRRGGCTFCRGRTWTSRARLPSPPYGLTMRRIRANAIAILTVAWILGTFYYLWQDNKPQSSPSSASQTRGRGHGQKLVPGRLEIHRDDRTIPLIVSERCWGGIKRKG